jgi:hypothetical protein
LHSFGLEHGVFIKMNKLLALKTNKQYLTLLVIGLLAILGAILVFYATRWGPAVFSDAVYYLGSADNLVHGRGFGLYWGANHFRPFAGDPPFYPLLVAFFQFFGGLDVVTASRWVGIFAFCIMIGLSGWLTYDLTKSFGLALGISIFLFPLGLSLGTNAASEVTFIPATIVGALWLLRYIKTGKYLDLVVSALFVAAAFISRYTGVALLISGMLCLMFFPAWKWKRRIIDMFVFGGIACLPMLIWLGWAYKQTGMIGERALRLPDIFALSVRFRLAFSAILWDWVPFLPADAGYNIQKWSLLVVFAFLTVVCGLMIRSIRDNKADFIMFWMGLFVIYAFVYIVVYLLAYLFSLPTPDLIPRIFSPFLIATWLVILSCLFLLARQFRWLIVLPMLMVFSFIIIEFPGNAKHIIAMHEDGNGYTSRKWRESPMIAALADLPVETQIVTNEPAAVLFLTGHPAHFLPEVLETQPSAAFYRFGDGLPDNPQQAVFREDGAALALFSSVYYQLEKVYFEKTTGKLASLVQGLTLYRQFGTDDEIYFYKPEFLPK